MVDTFACPIFFDTNNRVFGVYDDRHCLKFHFGLQR